MNTSTDPDLINVDVTSRTASIDLAAMELQFTYLHTYIQLKLKYLCGHKKSCVRTHAHIHTHKHTHTHTLTHTHTHTRVYHCGVSMGSMMSPEREHFPILILFGSLPIMSKCMCV